MRKNANKFYYYLGFTGLLVLSLYSCKKDSNVNSNLEQNISSGVAVENGMLSFQNQEVFSNTMTKLNKLSLRDVDQWASKFNFQNLKSDTLSNIPAAEVADPVFARVLSNNASIKIGDKIFVLKSNQEFLIKDDNMNSYNKLIKGEKINSNIISSRKINNVSNLIMGTVNNGSINVSIPKLMAENGSGLWAGKQTFESPEYDNGRPEKVYMEVWSESYAVYSSSGALLRGMAFRKGGAFGGKKWRDDFMNFARVSGYYNQTSNPSNRTYFDSGAQYSQEEVKVQFTTDGLSGNSAPYFTAVSINWNYQKAPSNPTSTQNWFF